MKLKTKKTIILDNKLLSGLAKLSMNLLSSQEIEI